MLIGPNGSGKSTAAARAVPVAEAQARGGGARRKSIHSLSAKEVARRLAILPQLLIAPESITVEDLVGFGRHPQRRSLISRRDGGRKDSVEWALAVTGTEELRHRQVDQLSGGQRQRAGSRCASPRAPT